MKTSLLYINLYYLLIICITTGCQAQDYFGSDYLTIVRNIELPGVKGRIDHLAINLKDNFIYVAALENNSIEVVDLNNGKAIHSIKNLDEPQGIAYLPVQNEIVVANAGNGNCIFYNAGTYAVTATINLGNDADNIRYDAATEKIYVGYGSGAIAVINATTHEQVADIKLAAHPESFQLDKKNDLLFVNLPGANSVAVISLTQLRVIDTWKLKDLRGNYPMTLDTTNNHVLIAFRHPAVLVEFDTKGKEISRIKMVSDADDIFYYENKQEIFASGGGGAINIFKKVGGDNYKQVANISTRDGARTSLLIPTMETFVLAERARDSRPASLIVYRSDHR